MFESLQRRPFPLVCVCGATGGAIFELDRIRASTVFNLMSLPEILITSALGALASVTFLFVVVNTDRADWIRLASFAGLCGFFHAIVIEAGQNFLISRGEQELASTAVNYANRLNEIAIKLDNEAISLEGAIDESAPLLRNLNEAVEKIDSRSAVSSIEVALPKLSTFSKIDDARLEFLLGLSSNLDGDVAPVKTKDFLESDWQNAIWSEESTPNSDAVISLDGYSFPSEELELDPMDRNFLRDFVESGKASRKW